MLKYNIGQPLFKGQPVPPAGMYYRYQDQEHLMMMVLPHGPSSLSYHSILEEPAEFAFTLQENILWFLARFGEGIWQISPYYWHFVPRIGRSLPRNIERPDGSAELHILVIDELLGCVQGSRKAILPPTFTQVLHRTIEQQSLLPDMGMIEHEEALKRVQKKFPHPQNLLPFTLAHMVDHPAPLGRHFRNSPMETETNT